MTSTITIRLADNQRNTPDLYQLDNLSTTLTIDFSGMGVDSWQKYVDFETSDGNKTRMELGTDIVAIIDLSNTVTVAGVLKVNPIALLPVEGSTVDIAQRGFKTYIFNVQETVNSYGYNSENRNDMILPMAENLNQLMEYHKVKILNVDSDLNFVKEEGNYGYIGVHEVRNAPTQQAFVLQVVPLPLEAGGVLQTFIGVTEPGGHTYRRMYFQDTDTFTDWSDPTFDLEELRDWTTSQFNTMAGVTTELLDDLTNLTSTVSSISLNINSMLSRITALEGKVATNTTNIGNLTANLSSVETQLQSDIDTLNDTVILNNNTLSDELSDLQTTVTQNNSTLNSRMDNAETRIGVLENNTLDINDLGQNLIPVANRQFEGWTAQGGATVTVTKVPLEVFEGGYTRNLLRNGKKIIAYSNDNIAYPITNQIINENDVEFVRIKRVPSDNKTFSIYNNLPTVTSVKGRKITVSFKARVNIASRWEMMIRAYGVDGTSETLQGNLTEVSLGTEWTSFKFTVEATSSFNTAGLRVIPYTPRNVDSSNIDNLQLDLTDYKIEFGDNLNVFYTKAWEDYTDAEKPAAYIETVGGTLSSKLALPITLTETSQHILNSVIKNVGVYGLYWRNVPSTQKVLIQPNEKRDISLLVETPTTNNEISPSFGVVTSATDSLKFYAYNPQVVRIPTGLSNILSLYKKIV